MCSISEGNLRQKTRKKMREEKEIWDHVLIIAHSMSDKIKIFHSFSLYCVLNCCWLPSFPLEWIFCKSCHTLNSIYMWIWWAAIFQFEGKPTEYFLVVLKLIIWHHTTWEVPEENLNKFPRKIVQQISYVSNRPDYYQHSLPSATKKMCVPLSPRTIMRTYLWMDKGEWATVDITRRKKTIKISFRLMKNI